MKRRVAILISGRGSNMAALIEAARQADFPAEIVAVISNRADAAGLETAAAQGIPTEVIESRPFGKDRGETDDHLHIDLGFVVSVPRDAPVEAAGLTTPASEIL